jgi:membrane-associated protein
MFDVKELLMGMTPYVQYVSFGLLMLSGMSMPVSEDIVFIISASIAATVAPKNLHIIFAGCFLGAYLSDILAYSIGRYGLKKIIFSPFMVKLKIINPDRIQSRLYTMQNYFASYGGKTLFFGRFIPFGMRNVIFMTCGLIKMNPVKFMIIDLCAVTCTSLILFSLGYTFGNNYEVIFPYLDRYKYILAGLIIVVIAIFIAKNIIKKRRAAMTGNNSKNEVTPKNPIIK